MASHSSANNANELAVSQDTRLKNTLVKSQRFADISSSASAKPAVVRANLIPMLIPSARQRGGFARPHRNQLRQRSTSRSIQRARDGDIDRPAVEEPRVTVRLVAFTEPIVAQAVEHRDIARSRGEGRGHMI